MNKIDLIYGVLIGLATSILGSTIFIMAFTDYGVVEGFGRLRAGGAFGKLLALGAVLNILVFFALLHFRKEMMARGVVLSLILLSIYTFFI